MEVTDREKQIVTQAEAELAASGTDDIARLWIQRGVGLIVAKVQTRSRNWKRFWLSCKPASRTHAKLTNGTTRIRHRLP